MTRIGGWMVALCALGVAACDSPSGGQPFAGGADGDTTAGAPDTTGGGDTLGPAPDAADPGTVTPPPLEVDPECVDGQYTEPLPTPDASLQAAKAAYDGADPVSFIVQALDVRYPTGRWILEQGLAAEGGFGPEDCVETFLGQTGSAEQVIGQLSTLVHECGHFADTGAGGFASATYLVTPDLTLSCQGGGSRAAGGGTTFSRSLLTGDPYSPLLPPCEGGGGFGGGGDGCDSYAPIYLDGDPDDGQFQSGDQGFDSLMEETVQYVNSLATGYAFHDHYAGSVSERDGILTFLWYLERYLRLARLEHPDTYATLTDDPCWREAILTVWGRAWLYLDLTEDLPALGLDDDALLELVTAPELLQEIQRVREAEGC
ncbi:MAG: hypothetical protein ACQEXJ_21955 [Myxococcota bacterium]